MSRHAFGEILGNEAGFFARVRSLDDAGTADVPRDLKGYGLDEWLDCAVVGWDEPMQTYFLQAPEEGDELSWWFGTAYAEIPTFSELCGVIQRLFGDAVKFEFVDRIERAQEVFPTTAFSNIGRSSPTRSLDTNPEKMAMLSRARAT